MSESQTIICPECETLQQGDAPFCDNCGYRLGRPEPTSADVPTEVEHQPVTADDIAAYKAGASPKAPSSSSREMMVPTEVEGHPAITPEQAAAARDATEVEGLSAIEPGVPTEPDGTPAVSPADVSGLHAASGPLRDEAKSRSVLWGALWVISLVATAMVAVWVTRSEQPEAKSSPAPTAQAETLDVASATFEAGLRENVRAFILRTCLKVADDSSECDQDELLAGEFPVREATVDAFQIDALEVTVGAYQRCVKAGDCEPIGWDACKVYTHQGLQISLRVPRALQQPTSPTTCVRHADAVAYCKHVEGRLPTADEWEYAARGTDRRIFPWGATWDATAANWGEMDVTRFPVVGTIDGFEWAAPPGSYPTGAAPSGAHDMAGNVAEWVDADPPHARGGAWTSTPFELRTTGRLDVPASERRTDVGFRCAY